MKTPILKTLALLGILAATTSVASAQVEITEWSYKGLFGEYIEITNLGTTAQNLTGWSYDDNSGLAGTVPLPAMSLAAGKSLIITEVSEDIFRQAWYTEPSKPDNGVIILANNTINLGRSDTINIYDAAGQPASTLQYNDEAANGPRTEDVSGIPGSLGGPTAADWTLSADSSGTPLGNAWKAGAPGATGPVGSPGTYPN